MGDTLQSASPTHKFVLAAIRCHTIRATAAMDAQSRRPAKRSEEASCSASAGILNGSFFMKCEIENAGFINRHSATLSAGLRM